jgi:hypothetical protein
MKDLREAAFVFTFVALALVGVDAIAQTNWVVCESIMNGTQQSFAGSCPSGWVFISH